MKPHTQVALDALSPRSDLPPARYALELQPGRSAGELSARLEAELTEYEPSTRPISPTDHGVVILELAAKTLFGTPPTEAFAAGYALADDFDVRVAEPDLPTPFFPEEDPPPEGAPVAEAFRFPPGCWVDVEQLPDRWALDRIRAPEAWAFSEAHGRPSRGAGIVIAQPDTGVIQHTELNGVHRVGGYDVLGHDSDPTDPLNGQNPGHGTGTASVVVSPDTLRVCGSAPAAGHMPIRAIQSVIVTSQVSVAEAIARAVADGAHVITMSLGGVPAEVLQRAIRAAVAADVIVLAAAGNCVRLVVFPARYDECIAVAGTNAADRPWKGSCRGSAVDIAAPAQNVLKAGVANGSAVTQGQGTSFAVALTAGVAALWLAHHGRANLIASAKARGETLQVMFRRLVRASARRPSGWDTFQYGAGIVDARALLAAELDAGLDRESVLPPEPGTEPGFAVAGLVAEAVGPEAAADPDLDWRRYGPELTTALLDAQLAAAGDGTDQDGIHREAPTPPVTRELAEAITNPRLRDRLRLDDGLSGSEVGEEGPS